MTTTTWAAGSTRATLAYLRLELPRALRNGRFVALTLAFPVAFYLLFTRVLAFDAANDPDAQAWFMVSMATYGAIGAALSIAVRVAIERSNGWTRLLRVMPLPPLSYVAAKLVTAYLTAVPAIALVMATALVVNGVALSATTWAAVLVSLVLGVLPFAAMGVAIGYLFDENTAQLVFIVAFVGLAVLGGLWAPLSSFPETVAAVGHILPSYAMANLGWSALAGQAPQAADILTLSAWGLAFVALVAWRYRRADLQARG